MGVLSVACFGFLYAMCTLECRGLGYSGLPQEMTRSGSLSHNLVS